MEQYINFLIKYHEPIIWLAVLIALFMWLVVSIVNYSPVKKQEPINSERAMARYRIFFGIQPPKRKKLIILSRLKTIFQ